MDCTASMGPWIEAAKTTIKEMIAALPAEEPHKRVAFVPYRDFHDATDAPMPFTEDLDEVTRFIDRQEATGGQDCPEDVAGGLAAALALGWQAETRTLVLVTDAPCHGEKYHHSGDNYPRGDPTGLSMVQLMSALRLGNVDVTFVQLTSETDKMQGMLRAAYEQAAGAENIRKFELRDLREILGALAPLEPFGTFGGGLGLSDGSTAAPETYSRMLSAAVGPSIASSYATTMTGTYTTSAPMSRTLPPVASADAPAAAAGGFHSY